MNAPRWFYALVAACALVSTTALVAYAVVRRDTGRWVPVTIDGSVVRIIDSRTGVVCQAQVVKPHYRWCLTVRGDST